MTELILGSHYDHLRKEYLRCSTTQIVDKLIQEMQINQLKSKSIIKMEDKINDLELQIKNKGIVLTQGKQHKLQQLKEAYQGKQGKRDVDTPRTPQAQKSQMRYRQLNSTRTPQRQQFYALSSPSRNADFLRVSLQQSTRTIAQISAKNTLLISQTNNLRQQMQILVNINNTLKSQLSQMQMNQQALLKQNSELTLDCQFRVQQYEKSVQIVQKLLIQLQEFKQLHSQKTQIIKKMNDTNNELQIMGARLSGQIQSLQQRQQQFQKKIKELLESQTQYQQQIVRLNESNSQKQLIIDSLGRQNAKFTQSLENQINNCQILQKLISQMRQRNHNLEKKGYSYQTNNKLLQSSLHQRTIEVQILQKLKFQLQTHNKKYKQQNQSLRKQLISMSNDFKQQIKSQLKLIGQYQKVQKPKQLLSNLKQKFKGEDKHKQFKLTSFNQKLNSERSICQLEVQDDVVQKLERQKEKQKEENALKLKTSSDGLKSLVVSIQRKMNQLIGTYDVLNEKTTQLTKKIS